MDQKAFQQILKDALKNELSPLLIGVRNEIEALGKTYEMVRQASAVSLNLSPEALESMKHHDGKTPIKGTDYFTDTEVEDFIKKSTPVKGTDYFTAKEVEDFKTAVTPKKGVDYDDGKPGYTPIRGTDYFTAKDIAWFIEKVTPKKGVDYFDGVTKTIVDYTDITGEEIRNKLESLTGASRLDVKAIKGMSEEVQRHIKNFHAPASQGGPMGAGSDTGGRTYISAGTNVTVTGTGTLADPYIVNATGGGGGGSAGGSPTQLQYNSAGSFAGISKITTNGTDTTFVSINQYFVDTTDATKRFRFVTSSIGTGLTRDLTVPNVNGTLVTTGNLTDITTVGTIGTGIWNGTVIAGQYGGTGIANTGKTITIGGNFTTSGAFTTTLTVTANTSVTLPTAGTLATLAGSETFTNKDLTSGTNTFPTFNQNTTGSAAKWTTARNLAGNSVDGSANVAFANKFIVQGTTDTGLSGAQFLGALATGILKNTTTTGVLSIAVAGTDYQAPITLTTTGTSGAATFIGNVLNIPQYSGGGGGGTVTNTGGNLTANSVVLGAGTVDTKVVAGITTDGTSQLNLGVASTTLGKLKMFGNTSGDVTIQPAAAAGTAVVLTLPNATGTLVTDQFAAYSMYVNNTASTATRAAVTYQGFTDLTYSGTTTWTGTTAPSGALTQTYSWQQIDKWVKLRLTSYNVTNGTSLTAVTFTLPTDCPNPLEPSGMGAADDILYSGTGYITTNRATEPTIMGRAFLKVNSADTGWELKIVSSSVSARYATITIMYEAA